MKKILIIQTAFAGDLILTTPLIHAAKDQFAPCSIDVLCIPSTASLLKNNPYINTIIVYDKRNDRFAVSLFSFRRKEMREKKYDIVLSPHRSFRSALIARFTNAKQRITFDTSPGRFFYTHIVRYDARAHEVERVLSLMRIFNQPILSDYRPQLFPGKDEIKEAEIFMRDNAISRECICIAPGSIWATKRWTVQGYSRLAQQLISDGFDVILIGGSDDERICESILRQNDSMHCFNSAGKISFLASAEIIQRSRVLVSNDSAPVHVASAMQTPVVDIYGPTSPAFGFTPHKVDHKIVQNEGLNCNPCNIHGGEKCPIHIFVCMNDLGWGKVYRAVLELLRKKC